MNAASFRCTRKSGPLLIRSDKPETRLFHFPLMCVRVQDTLLVTFNRIISEEKEAAALKISLLDRRGKVFCSRLTLFPLFCRLIGRQSAPPCPPPPLRRNFFCQSTHTRITTYFAVLVSNEFDILEQRKLHAALH